MILSDIAANRDLGLDSERYFPVGNTARLAHMLASPYEATSAEAQMIKWRFDWVQSAERPSTIYRAFMPPSAQDVRNPERIGTPLPAKVAACQEQEIGGAKGGERVCQSGRIPVVDVYTTKKK